jgi:hypothetical protein
LNVLGDIPRLEGEYDEARNFHGRAAAMAEELGWHGLVPSMRHNLAWALHGVGDDERAIAYFSATVREFQRMGDVRGVAECLVGLACAVPRPSAAAQLFAASVTLLAASGMTLSHPNQREYDRESAQTRLVLGEEAWQVAWAAGVKLSLDQALALVVSGAPE